MKPLMNKTLTTLRTHRYAIVDAATFLIGFLAKIGLTTAIAAALFYIAPAAWRMADGDPVAESFLLKTAILMGGIIAIVWVGFKAAHAPHHTSRPARINPHDHDRLPDIARYTAIQATVATRSGATPTLLDTFLTPDIYWGTLDWAFPNTSSHADRAWASALIHLAGPDPTHPNPNKRNTTQALEHLTEIVAGGTTPTNVTGPLTLNDLLTEAVTHINEITATHQDTIAQLADQLQQHRLYTRDEIPALLQNLTYATTQHPGPVPGTSLSTSHNERPTP